MTLNKIVVSIVVALLAIGAYRFAKESGEPAPSETTSQAVRPAAAPPNAAPVPIQKKQPAALPKSTDKPESSPEPSDGSSHSPEPQPCPYYVSKDPRTVMPEDFVPENLQQVTGPSAYEIKKEGVKNLSKEDEQSLYDETLLTAEAAEALDELIDAAKSDKVDLYAYSGYRSYETQKLVYDRNVKKLGKKKADQVSAIPGHSEHQTGLAMDITSKNLVEKYRKDKTKSPLNESFGEDREGIWLAKNAYKFGFVMSYPKGKEGITGYSYEPWHFRYVGKEVAAVVETAGLTLGEYVNGRCSS